MPWPLLEAVVLPREARENPFQGKMTLLSVMAVLAESACPFTHFFSQHTSGSPCRMPGDWLACWERSKPTNGVRISPQGERNRTGRHL